jgi:HPt (histidine-containing phosphotransfer) domain-containing protein
MLDKTAALEALQITEEIYDELLVEFLADADEELAALDAALRTTDFPKASSVAHSLKGMAGNLRLDTCYNIALAIESAAKAGDSASVEGDSVALRSAVEEIRHSMRR